ncbi:MAG: hypothetical protein EOP06_11815 [Proteobacteria bacterium]|nr:MAG: hypothetical protein EOP06_11815 [Pseudomonadota bacterium]
MVRQAGPEPSNDAPGWSETRDFEACVSGMPISSSADFALGATIAYTEDSESVAVLNIGARLTESERSALRKAVDSEVLADNDWVEGSHGEILTKRGRTVFDVGFATAIRKVLDEK